MKFKLGFLLGAAAGAWIANRASELQHGPEGRSSKSSAAAADDAAEKLRALTGLARERFTDLIDGPIGNIARERITDILGASMAGSRTSATGGSSGSHDDFDDDPIDVKAS